MLLKQLNNDQAIEETTFVAAIKVVESLLSDSLLLLESQENLKSVIKKILVTNKDISERLAVSLAKILLFSTIMQELIDRKKRYKRHSLLHLVYDRISDVTSRQLTPAIKGVDIDSDFINNTKTVLAQLTGKSDSREEVKQTFDNILNRLTNSTVEKNRLKLMKLASLIVQSNQDDQKRKQLINQYTF
jgi:hypothetical protein